MTGGQANQRPRGTLIRVDGLDSTCRQYEHKRSETKRRLVLLVQKLLLKFEEFQQQSIAPQIESAL